MEIIKMKFFEDSLVQRVAEFSELEFASKSEAKEKINTFKNEVKNIYLEKDNLLKQEIKNQLVVLKENHLKTLASYDEKLKLDLEELNKEKDVNPKEFSILKFFRINIFFFI